MTPEMTPVFISYDDRDRYFVNLLEALLVHEEVPCWRDRDRIAAGDRFKTDFRRSQDLALPDHGRLQAFRRIEVGDGGGERLSSRRSAGAHDHSRHPRCHASRSRLAR